MIQQRENAHNALSGRCLAGYRRTCGTCAHFSGARGHGPALCSRLLITCRPGDRAWDCADWTRKNAEGGT